VKQKTSEKSAKTKFLILHFRKRDYINDNGNTLIAICCIDPIIAAFATIIVQPSLRAVDI